MINELQGACQGTKIPTALLSSGIVFIVGSSFQTIAVICLCLRERRGKIHLLYKIITILVALVQLALLCTSAWWFAKIDDDDCVRFFSLIFTAI